MILEWSDELSIGNTALDFEHKGLVLAVSDIAQAIKEKNLEVLEQRFEFLEMQLQSHFLHEEKLVKATNSDFPEYKRAQQYSLNDIKYLRNELMGKKVWSDFAAEHYSNFLARWLIDEHINQLNMKMRPALQALPCKHN